MYGLAAVFYFLAGTIAVANMFVFFTPAAERKTGNCYVK